MRNPRIWMADDIQSKHCSDIGCTCKKRTLPSRSSQSRRKQERRRAEVAAMVKVMVTTEWAFIEH